MWVLLHAGAEMSTEDSLETRVVIAHAKRLGVPAVTITFLHSLRVFETYELWSSEPEDRCGPDHSEALVAVFQAAREPVGEPARPAVVAWGVTSQAAAGPVSRVVDAAALFGVPLHCMGQQGPHPRRAIDAGRDQVLIPWERPT